MSSIPSYQRIVDDITVKIDSGELKSGDQLPSTRQLRIQYGVSAQPVKTALTVLHAWGRTKGHQGLGVFVI